MSTACTPSSKRCAAAYIAPFILLLAALISCAPSNGGKGHDAHKQTSAQQKKKYHCPMHPNYTADKPGQCPICGMDLVPIENDEHEAAVKKKKTMYRSTMNLKEISDKPGNDSMGMKMEAFEVEESTASIASGVQGYASIKIDPGRQQLIGVKIDTVSKRSLTKRIRTVGRVSNDPELYNAQEEYITSLRHYNEMKTEVSPDVSDRSKSMVESARFKLKLLGFSDQQINNIGARAEPDISLINATGQSSAWVYAQIYEYDLSYVRSGQTALIKIPAAGGRELVGSVRSIDPVLDTQTRSARARIYIDNTLGLLRSEAYVNVSIAIPVGTVVAIPEDAVLDTGTRMIIFVDKGEGHFEPREVALGEKVDAFYVVRSGVKEGERVVTSANFLIDSESQLKAALKQMSGGK